MSVRFSDTDVPIKYLALFVALTPWMSFGSDACRYLSQASVARAFPGAHEYLCLGISPRCEEKSERDCAQSELCKIERGSSSGENCSPCLPDAVFRRCRNIEESTLAEIIKSFVHCQSRSGFRWETRNGDAWGKCVQEMAIEQLYRSHGHGEKN